MRLIAHRGYAVHAPQNSLEAFEAAGKLGYWAIETDVHRTQDGKLVCCHDQTVDSIFDGSGAIAYMPWSAIASLRFRPEKKNGSLLDERMPLFDEYLQICQTYHAVPFIETKTYDVREVLTAAFRFFTPEQVVLSSTDIGHLRLARQFSKDVFIHHIFSDEMAMNELAHMQPAGLSLNYPNLDRFDPHWVEVVHAKGLALCLRAGDTPEQVARMEKLGLDYVPTNCTVPLQVETGR